MISIALERANSVEGIEDQVNPLYMSVFYTFCSFWVLHTSLQQKRVYTSLGPSCAQCIHQILLLSARACMHFEQTTIAIHEEEVPKLVYTLFWCKPVYMSL